MKNNPHNFSLKTVILGGGKGERLWPLSRQSLPKQFLSLTNNVSLIMETFNRLKKLSNRLNQKIYFSATADFEGLVKKELKNEKTEKDFFIREPFLKDTAAAILLAALKLKMSNKAKDNDVLFFVPADAHIQKEQSFLKDIQKASEIAAYSEKLVLLGIPPSRPAIEYGYLQVRKLNGREKKTLFTPSSSVDIRKKTAKKAENGEKSEISSPNNKKLTQWLDEIYTVTHFKEKPKQQVANRYIRSKKYLWNSGMFFIRVGFLLKLFAELTPKHLQLVSDYVRLSRNGEEMQAKKHYQKIDKISFDYAIVEKIPKDIVALKANFLWDDLGSLQSLFRLVKKDKDGNALSKKTMAYESTNCLMKGEGLSQRVVLYGLDSVMMIITKDTILLTTEEKSKHVKDLLKHLKKKDNSLL